MAEAGGSPAGRKATSLTREQLARRDSMEIVLRYHTELSNLGEYRELTLEQRAEQIARYITDGVAPDWSSGYSFREMPGSSTESGAGGKPPPSAG